MVPYINYQGQKLTKSKKYISNDDFSTGVGEGTSHHSNSIITVGGINCNEMEMYKTINRASAVFNQTLQTQHCYQMCRLNLMYKLALEDVWMIDGIILLVMKDTAQMKGI